jgi:ribonuclease J
MRARIHRGAREIGGSCVELEEAGKRIVIDVARPLDADSGVDLQLPPVPGLAGRDPSLLGVLVSHPHPDHYGLVEAVEPSVPIYIGERAQQILNAAALFTRGSIRVQAAAFFQDRAPLEIGPFRVTPFLMDHSAFDAYALLVEAGGDRLLYSGDIRAHGRKSRLFERFVAQPPRDVDTLLLEGTHVRDGEALAAGLSEREVEDRCLEVLRETSGMVLACYSPQNIDRVVTMFRAAKRSGRRLVLDLYAAEVAGATGRADTIPQADWEDVRVFVPLTQRVRIKNERAFDRIERVKPHRLYPEQLASQAHELVMTFRYSMATELDRARCLAGAHAIWSMWPGYLDEPAGIRLRNWLDRHGVPITLAHSSGHASVEELQRFAAAVNPERLVPIHTSAPQLFPGLFEHVRLRDDGEWWTV